MFLRNVSVCWLLGEVWSWTRWPGLWVELGMCSSCELETVNCKSIFTILLKGRDRELVILISWTQKWVDSGLKKINKWMPSFHDGLHFHSWRPENSFQWAQKKWLCCHFPDLKLQNLQGYVWHYFIEQCPSFYHSFQYYSWT